MTDTCVNTSGTCGDLFTLFSNDQSNFQATLVADFRKTRVLLILLRSTVTKEEAVLIASTANYPVTRVQDLEIKTALPIDNNFR